jgi:hypothetical protein
MKTCEACRDKPARFRNAKRRWKADDDHDMCPRCWRSTLDAFFAGTLLPRRIPILRLHYVGVSLG